MPNESFILFKEQPYFSYYDEKYFYAWLQSIDGVTRVGGANGGNLRVDLSSSYLTRTAAFDLIALFTRYSCPLFPLRDHIAPEDIDYFKRPEARWHEELFGNEGSHPRA